MRIADTGTIIPINDRTAHFIAGEVEMDGLHRLATYCYSACPPSQFPVGIHPLYANRAIVLPSNDYSALTIGYGHVRREVLALIFIEHPVNQPYHKQYRYQTTKSRNHDSTFHVIPLSC
ncbi:MAG: hypothetical protein R6U89_11995 [Dehalococcoidia bacterium]